MMGPVPAASTRISLGSLLWREHHALFGRWLARLRREPFAIAGTVVQPVIWPPSPVATTSAS